MLAHVLAHVLTNLFLPSYNELKLLCIANETHQSDHLQSTRMYLVSVTESKQGLGEGM